MTAMLTLHIDHHGDCHFDRHVDHHIEFHVVLFVLHNQHWILFLDQSLHQLDILVEMVGFIPFQEILDAWEEVDFETSENLYHWTILGHGHLMLVEPQIHKGKGIGNMVYFNTWYPCFSCFVYHYLIHTIQLLGWSLWTHLMHSEMEMYDPGPLNLTEHAWYTPYFTFTIQLQKCKIFV